MTENFHCPICKTKLELKKIKKVYSIFYCFYCERKWNVLNEKTSEGEIQMRTKELPKIDTKKYVGVKTQIDSANVVNTKYGLALKIESKPLEEIAEGKFLRASSIYSFMSDEEGTYIGLGSKLDNFLKANSIESKDLPDEMVEGMQIIELLDKPVVVQLNTKSGFLDLV